MSLLAIAPLSLAGSANAAIFTPGDQLNFNSLVQLNNAGNPSFPIPDLSTPGDDVSGGADGSIDVLFLPTTVSPIDVNNRVFDCNGPMGVDCRPGDLGSTTASAGTGAFANLLFNVLGDVRSFDGTGLGVGPADNLNEVNDFLSSTNNYIRVDDPAAGRYYSFSLTSVPLFAVNPVGAIPGLDTGFFLFNGDGKVGAFDLMTDELLDEAHVSYSTTGQFLFDCVSDGDGSAVPFPTAINNPDCSTADVFGGDGVTNATTASFSTFVEVKAVPEPSSIIGLIAVGLGASLVRKNSKKV